MGLLLGKKEVKERNNPCTAAAAVSPKYILICLQLKYICVTQLRHFRSICNLSTRTNIHWSRPGIKRNWSRILSGIQKFSQIWSGWLIIRYLVRLTLVAQHPDGEKRRLKKENNPCMPAAAAVWHTETPFQGDYWISQPSRIGYLEQKCLCVAQLDDYQYIVIADVAYQINW